MFKNYWKTAFRNLVRRRLYTSINIFGLTVALTSLLLIGMYIFHELSYDRFNVNADRIVRMTMEYRKAGTVNRTATTGTKPGPQLARVFPEIRNYVRTFVTHAVIATKDQSFEEPRVLYADPGFFKMFSFPLAKGDAVTALDAPGNIAISESAARKYFGNSDPMGRTLTSGGRSFSVSAVFKDVPDNSQLQFDVVTQFNNLGNGVAGEQWWTANWITYLLLDRSQDLVPLQKKIARYMQSPEVRQEARLTGNDYLTYHLEPLKSVHLYSSLDGFEPNGSIRTVYILATIALLILLIAGANYTNLATAQSATRTGEIGVRKVIGASKSQIFIQFMGESVLVALLAAALALILSVFLLPLFNQVTGGQFSTRDLIRSWPLLTLLGSALLAGAGAGLYPALLLSGTRVLTVLGKGFNFTGGNAFLRKALIVIQFTISVFLIIFTVVVLQQLRFLQNKDLGYEKSHIVVLPIGGDMHSHFLNLKAAFEAVPGVEAVTASYDTPENVGWGDDITATDEKGTHDISLTALPVDLDFTRTLKMKVIAGRDFVPSDFGLMDTSDNDAHYRQPFIINEVLAEKLGWSPEEAIGKTITKGVSGPVVGVVKNFNFHSLHDPIGPMILFLGRDYSRNFLLRISGKDIHKTIAKLQAVWNDRIADRPFTYQFLEAAYNKLYQSEQKSSLLFSMASALAIVLACLGLFGLTAITTVQRAKEIGIRRVLGAGIGHIILLVSSNFFVWVVLAIAVATPLAWWACNRWLQDFAYRVPVHTYVFCIAGFLTAVIALATVGYHAVKISLVSPSKSLRTE